MPVVKGGVWTNIEDEILKASVSKYGLQQWARVSSLLARKTAKQCKARWTEWLDPAIKKIEWSRDEDEKLLHLAKLMPTQWRSIAPIVGRTANQCLDRYQKLLDEAEAADVSELAKGLSLAGTGGPESRAPTGEDLRRLRPGEVDTNPESKPARPDTIDLDEDEKEMLSEARARLANTQGKKAKRKARERQQEESRRLALLQKRRELKTAGINVKVTTRKPGQMDYNADIPFEKKPAPGFHDTSEELVRNDFQLANFDPRKLQLASGKRKDDGEDADASDRKRRRADGANKDAPSAGLQAAAARAGHMQKIREAEQSSKRRALVLPAPQVGDDELDEIVKMGKTGEAAATRVARDGHGNEDEDHGSDEAAGSSARGLIGSYAQLNTATPIRTPLMAPQDDHIAVELRNIRAQANIQSVLLGGETPSVHESGSTGYQSATPQRHVVSTPNPLATPLRQANGPLGPGATPMGSGQTPMRTPRDQFALNTDGGMVSGAAATPHDMRAAQIAIRGSLRSSLAALPKPKTVDFQLAAPEDQPEGTGGGGAAAAAQQEDAGQRDRRLAQIAAANAEAERKRQTQVVQRGLPRPMVVNLETMLDSAAGAGSVERALICAEMARVVAHDAATLADSKLIGKQKVVKLEKYEDKELAGARALLAQETDGAATDTTELPAIFAARSERSVLLGLSGYEDDETANSIATRKLEVSLKLALRPSRTSVVF